MVTIEKVEAELFALRIEKHKALVKERQVFKRELARNLKIPFRQAFPSQPKQPTAISIQRRKTREEKARKARQEQQAQLTLFTEQQLAKALAILQEMENPK